jgi:hypothetical protein
MYFSTCMSLTIPSSAVEAGPSPKYILVYPYTDPSVPFDQLTPDQITFYFHVTNQTGKKTSLTVFGEGEQKTCGANCDGCYFQTLPSYAVEPEIAKQVAADFREQGFDMGLITADSFSDIALKRLAQAGSAFRYNRLVKQNGNAWTSGNLLSEEGWEDRLEQGWNLGYGIITISLYNTVIPHPMKGVPKTERIVQAIRNVQSWNGQKFPDGGGFDFITTQLISKKSCDLASMRKVAEWCLANGIRVCRFNAFANFLNNEAMREYELSAEDIATFWNSLAQLQEEFIDTPLQFGVSEDMSATGIKACIPYFNPNDGWEKFDEDNPYWCRAGYRLFSINQVAGETADQVRMVITGCVDNWSKAPLGEVVKDPETGRYMPKFNVPDIERLRAAVVNKTIATCWGGVGNPNKTNPRGHIQDPEAEAALFASLQSS